MNSNLHGKYLKAYGVFVLLLLSGSIWAQAGIGALPYTKTDNFNTYNPNSAANAAATLPAGWTVASTGTAFNGQGTGTSTTGGPFAYGTGGDFSAGALHSGSATVTYKVGFVNNSGTTITSLTLAWNYEQWRYAGNNSGWDCTGTGALATNTTLNGKDFAGAAAGSNGTATTTPVAAFTLTGLSIANGAAFGIQWVTNDAAGSDNGVSIDDFSIQAAGAVSPTAPVVTGGNVSGAVGAALNYQIAATNTPTSYAITSGTLPAGLSLNTSTGAITGTPTAVATNSVVNVTATNGSGTGAPAALNFTIAKGSQTIAFGTPTSKTYGAAPFAAGGSASSGLAVSYSSSDAGVATVSGTTITIVGAGSANITASQIGNANYNAAANVVRALLVNPKDLTISGASVSNKIYDGNTVAVITGTLSGVIAPDDVTVALSASFDSPSADINIPVTSASVLFGAGIANYNLVQPSGLQADITQKPLAIALATAQNKVFDGNTDAVITGTLTGVIAPDDVTLNGTGVFASPEIGINIPVTSTSTIIGDIANYFLVQPTGLTANISSEALTPQTITFDPLADAVYGDAPFVLPASASSGLAVSYVSSDTNVATVSGNTLTVTGIGTTTIIASQAGDTTYDSAPLVTQTLTVDPKALTVTATAGDKIYDGTDAAAISGNLVGVVGSDDVSFNGIGTFASNDAANDIPVTSLSFLTGTDVANYTLVQPESLTADITPLALVVNNATAGNKAYDATTAATISGAILVGIIGADDVSVSGGGIFASAAVGNNIAVTSNLSLTGSRASNYSIVQPSGLSAGITPLVLAVTGINASDKVYNQTTAAALSGTALLSGVIGSDDVSIAGTPIAVFNNRNVGNAKPVSVTGYTLAGADAGNYTISQPIILSAGITPASLTVTGAVAQNKQFDGTTTAALSSTGTLSGVIGSDNVAVSAAAVFATSAAGNNIPVTISLSGADAADYALIQPGITANITIGACGSNTASWNFTDGAVPSSPVVAGLTTGALTQGNNNGTTVLVTSTSASNNAGASAGNNAGAAARIGALNTGANGSAYFEFKLTPAAGYRVSLTGINFGSRETSTGPKAFALRSSLDNFTADLATSVLPASSAWIKYTPSVTSTTSNAGSEVTYRIYGYNGTGSPASGTANWRIDDLNLSVTLSAALSSSLTLETCSGSGFTYMPASNVSGATFTWTRAAVGGITNPAVTAQQNDNPDEILVNTTGSPVNVTYAYQIAANNCYSAQNVVVKVYPASVGGTVSGSTAVCAGTNSAALTLNGHTGSVIKWQSSSANDFSANLTDISNTTASLTVNNLTGTTYYRAVVASGNCGPEVSSPAAVTVNPNLTYYQDSDADGFGNISVTSTTCNGAPAGYVLNNTDCNDGDNSSFQLLSFYADADGDGYGTGTAQSVCSGNVTVPAGFATNNLDCDDTRNTVHPGAVEIGYNGIDDDCDGSIDEGFPPKVTAMQAAQCNTVLAAIDSPLVANIVGGAQGYRWRITTMTGPYAGQVQFLDTALRTMKLTSLASYAFDTQYQAEVAVYFTGFLQPYTASACTVTTPAATTQLTSCGQTLTTASDVIYAGIIPFATGYKFRITDPINPLMTQEIERPIREFRMNLITNFAVQYGKAYSVEVAVRNTDGSYLPYGSICTVNTPVFPTTSLQDAQCDNYIVPANATQIYATSYPAAIAYAFQLTGSGLPAEGLEVVKAIRTFTLNDFTGLVPGANYNVKVRLIFNASDAPGPYGKTCTIITPGLSRQTAVSETGSGFDAVAYPNPFIDSFNIDFSTPAKTIVNVKIYDMAGRLLEDKNAGAGDIKSFGFGRSLPSGVYNAIVNQGENVKTLRVVKR